MRRWVEEVRSLALPRFLLLSAERAACCNGLMQAGDYLSFAGRRKAASASASAPEGWTPASTEARRGGLSGQTKGFQNTARWIRTGGGRWMRAGNNDSRDGGGAVLGGGGMCSGVSCRRLVAEWCGVGGAID